ncbi:MAG: tetratricopeptide repeat protein [Oligoflexales bacterium]
MQVKHILIIGLILSSCATKNKRRNALIDENGLPVAIDKDAESGELLPMSLWSPMRRRLNASYYYLVAETEALKNNTQLAEKLTETAYNLDPNAHLAAKLVNMRVMNNKLPEALLQAKKLVLLYPKSARLHALYGRLLMHQGVTDRALTHFEKAMVLDPKLWDSYLGIIEIYKNTKEDVKAIAVARDLVKQNPTSAEAYGMLAKLYLATEQKKEALKAARRAYDLRGNDPETILIYAITLELNGESKQAVSLYEILFRFNPANEELMNRMLDLYRQIGDLNDALALVNEMDTSSEKVVPGIRIQKAFILWELKRYEEAAALLNDLTKLFPESDRIMYMAGLGQEKLEKTKEAMALYQDIPQKSQFWVHGQFRMVEIYRSEKKFDKAMELVKAMVDSDNERAQEFYPVGAKVLSDQKKFTEAAAFLEEGYDRHSDNIELLFLQGVYLEKGGNKDACAEVMEKVIAKDPKHSSGLNYLGYLLAESGKNLDRAEELIKKALEIKPNDGYYTDSLGWVYFQKKNYPKALETLNKANELAPNEGVILEHIGDVYGATGKKDKAKEYFTDALKTTLEDGDKERIEKKLEKLFVKDT